jgi:phosphoribosylpyrophosphate synthetase
MANPVLFHAPGTEEIASEIVALDDHRIERGSIRWEQFPDGTPHNFIEHLDRDVRDRDVIFLANFEDTRDIFTQMSVIYAFPRYDARSLKILIPFFPTATMDRIIKDGDILTSMTLVRMLDATDETQHGYPRIIILDPHDEHLYTSFRNAVVRFTSAMPLLMQGVRTSRASDGNRPRKVCFPDAGARKRYGADIDDAIICAKVRRPDGGVEVKIVEGDPTGCHVTIVDDMLQKGNTATECAIKLYAAGALAVAIRAVHGVLPHPSVSILGTARATEFVVTDSLPKKSKTMLFLPGSRRISVAPILARMLRRTS